MTTQNILSISHMMSPDTFISVKEIQKSPKKNITRYQNRNE